ncbi:phage holin family protein [Streptomyces sp. ODS28]|uniref:phage holin family protein n=1 Tax=Streptomyces sp. ODS28 TaxID=3136688 RepID=UPI0031EA0E87
MGDKEMYPRAGSAEGVGATATDISEPVARIVRQEIRVAEAELREEMRQQPRRRTLRLYSGATASALYGGGALALAVGLLLTLVMPGWAAFLIVAAVLFAASLALRNAAHEPHGSRESHRQHRQHAAQEPHAADGLGDMPTAAENVPRGTHHRA